ncbi:MAG: hypothetical protein M0T84_11830 [Betaproteobacteria bacterium]|nr:hypothetical protein [Betaproteobacteria bacterium]
MHKYTIPLKAGLIVGGLLLLSPNSNAAGLGRLTVSSALGQPLRARIEILRDPGESLSSFSARLASPQEYENAKLPWLAELAGLQLSIQKGAGGKAYLSITSNQAINDPFLDVLVDLNWTSGHLLRDYTLLIDPPGFQETEQTLAKPTAPALPGAQTPTVARQASAPYPSSPQPARPRRKVYRVKHGDTLDAVAARLRPQTVSLDQMVVGLYDANPHAFAGHNMNRLKAGRILRVPSAGALGAISPAKAQVQVRVQAADWRAYRQEVAAAVERAPGQPSVVHHAVSGQIQRAVPEAPKPVARSSDVLKVSRGESPTGAQLGSLQSQINAMQENLVAKSKALQDANSRIAELQKNIHDMQELLAIKNQMLAQAQKPAVAPATAPAQPAARLPVATVSHPAPAARPSIRHPAVPVRPAPQPPVQKAAWYEMLLSGPTNILVGGGALVVVLVGWLSLIGRRRRKSLALLEERIMTGGDLKTNTMLAGNTGAVVDTGNTSFLTDFSQAGLGTIDTHDVDPIAEAEVYMAYGRDAQAEEILKEAMQKDPERHEIQVKLLEIYAARKNLVAFETLASELYAAVGGKSGKIWDRASELGRELDPDNPLYAHPLSPGGKSAQSAVPAQPVPVDEAAGMPAEAAPAPAPADAIAAFAPLEGEERLPEPGVPPEDMPVEDVGLGLDLDLETIAPTQAATPAVETPAAEPAALWELPDSLDFDLSSLEQAGATAETPPVAETAPVGDDVPEAELSPVLEEETSVRSSAADAQARPPILEGAPSVELPALDLDLGETAQAPLEATPAVPSVPTDAVHSLDFELSLPEAPVAASSVPSPSDAPAPSAGEASLDFDFGLEDELAGPAPEEESAAASPGLDLSGISLDLDEPGEVVEVPAVAASPEDLDDEVATKLDLARAYLDMGDKEGAREILQEVLKEGNQIQQDDAKGLLAELG